MSGSSVTRKSTASDSIVCWCGRHAGATNTSPRSQLNVVPSIVVRPRAGNDAIDVVCGRAIRRGFRSRRVRMHVQAHRAQRRVERHLPPEPSARIGLRLLQFAFGPRPRETHRRRVGFFSIRFEFARVRLEEHRLERVDQRHVEIVDPVGGIVPPLPCPCQLHDGVSTTSPGNIGIRWPSTAVYAPASPSRIKRRRSACGGASARVRPARASDRPTPASHSYRSGCLRAG